MIVYTCTYVCACSIYDMYMYLLHAAYMAPEVILRRDMGRPMDIWSVGCVVIEMATGKVNSQTCVFRMHCYLSPPLPSLLSPLPSPPPPLSSPSFPPLSPFPPPLAAAMG